MTYLSALGCVLAIIAIVIVGGVIIAFLGNIIINAFDADRKYGKKIDDEEEIQSIKNNVYTSQAEAKNETTYTNLKSAEIADEDFDYAKEVDGASAKKEKEELENEIKSFGKTEIDSSEDDFEDDFFKDYKSSLSKPEASDDDIDDVDLLNMVNEVSSDVLEDKRAEDEEKAKETTSMLDKYSIDSVLNDEEDDDEEVEAVKEESDESLNEMRNIRDDIAVMLEEFRKGAKQTNDDEADVVAEDNSADIEEEVQRRVDEKLAENLRVVEELKKTLEEKDEEIKSRQDLEEQYSKINKEMVEKFTNQQRDIETQVQSTVSMLKEQLDSITKQLEEERSRNWKVAEASAVESKEKTIKVVENNVVENEPAKESAVEEEVEEVVKEIVEEEIENKAEEILSSTTEEINEIKERVENITTATTVQEVVTFQYSTEEQYLQRLEVLEERLRNAKKDLKINDKEFKPLEKVKKTLDRDKVKLRRKDALAAKKKVALYGVNNYVDIDKEKAEKLAHELELLDGLRLSVSHCEEIMNTNADRYPILERTHIILTNNIIDIESDILQLQKELKALRDKEDK